MASYSLDAAAEGAEAVSDHDRVTIVLTPELAVAQIERLRIELEAKDFVISCQRVESDRPRAKLAASEAACAPFLKDGETPAECIARWRGEALAVLELLRQERVRSEKAEAACAQMREALQGLEDWLPEADPELVDDYDRACGAAAAALATDAGKGWIDATGAVEGRCRPVTHWEGYQTVIASAEVPAEWDGSTVLVVRKP